MLGVVVRGVAVGAQVESFIPPCVSAAASGAFISLDLQEELPPFVSKHWLFSVASGGK
jgi:hypothetical protein